MLPHFILIKHTVWWLYSTHQRRCKGNSKETTVTSSVLKMHIYLAELDTFSLHSRRAATSFSEYVPSFSVWVWVVSRMSPNLLSQMILSGKYGWLCALNFWGFDEHCSSLSFWVWSSDNIGSLASGASNEGDMQESWALASIPGRPLVARRSGLVYFACTCAFITPKIITPYICGYCQ